MTKIHVVLPPLVAFLVAVLWTYLTRDMYHYNKGFATIFTINIFPLLAWTVALTVGYFLIESILRRFNIRHFTIQVTISLLLYASAVIIVETIGYHVLSIHNIGTSHYEGLPLCDCLHAPSWMQTGYFLLGPLHWLLLRMLFMKKYRKDARC